MNMFDVLQGLAIGVVAGVATGTLIFIILRKFGVDTESLTPRTKRFIAIFGPILLGLGALGVEMWLGVVQMPINEKDLFIIVVGTLFNIVTSQIEHGVYEL